MNETNSSPQMPPSGGNGSLHQLEMWLDHWLGQKAPQIPAGGREAIVKFAPWIILILLLLALPFLLTLFGIGAVFAPVAFMGGFRPSGMYYFMWAVTLVTVVLEAMALPGLFHRQRRGWQLLFYSSLISGVLNIVSFNVVGLLGTLIGLYLLFQIRSYYK